MDVKRMRDVLGRCQGHTGRLALLRAVAQEPLKAEWGRGEHAGDVRYTGVISGVAFEYVAYTTSDGRGWYFR